MRLGPHHSGYVKSVQLHRSLLCLVPFSVLVFSEVHLMFFLCWKPQGLGLNIAINIAWRSLFRNNYWIISGLRFTVHLPSYGFLWMCHYVRWEWGYHCTVCSKGQLDRFQLFGVERCYYCISFGPQPCSLSSCLLPIQLASSLYSQRYN